MNSTTGGLAGAEAEARKHLAKELKTEDIEVVGREVAVIAKTGEQLLRLTAIAPGGPNAPRQIVVDSSGKVRDLAESGQFFLPHIGAARPAGGPPARVTIDPSVNDLTLERCRRRSEVLTVAAPVSGATPKADVYLLADTTGSMGQSSMRSSWESARSWATPRSPASTSPTAWETTRTS